MADSLGDLLQAKNFEEPEEVLIIKNFLRENYNSDCTVTMAQNQIIIGVKGASLAGTLRMRLHELQALCQTKKRLVIRILG